MFAPYKLKLIMNHTDIYGFCRVVITNSYPPIVVYSGHSYKKALKAFAKYAKHNSVELWINGILVDSRS